MTSSLLSFEGFAFALNYGYDRVRFPAPLPVGSRVRMRATLATVTDIPGGAQITIVQTFEFEGGDEAGLRGGVAGAGVRGGVRRRRGVAVRAPTFRPASPLAGVERNCPLELATGDRALPLGASVPERRHEPATPAQGATMADASADPGLSARARSARPRRPPYRTR